jgi:hypothetical protein
MGFGASHADGCPPGLTPQGIRFNDELVSADGIRVTLLFEPHNTSEQIQAARSWCRNQFDVVGRVELRTLSAVEWEWEGWYRRHGLDPAAYIASASGCTALGGTEP